jgi:hypothetical protein
MASTKISALPSKAALIESDYLPLVDSSDISNKKATLKDIQKSLYSKIKFIEVKSDFPAPIAGVITLLDNLTYYVLATIDLTGDRIVCGQNTTILGGSSENCKLCSFGLAPSTPLVSSQWSLPMRNISLTHGTAISLDATGNANQALDWAGVNFLNCPIVGLVKNYSNFIATDCGFLNAGNMTFDGTIGTVGFITCIFDNTATGTSLIIPATAIITRRFRVVYSSFISLVGETALNVSTSASIPVEGYILAAANFAGGGTYTSGVLYNDNKALFQNCRGVTNSISIGQAYMVNNVVATTIAVAGTFYKIIGTTSPSVLNQRFSHSANRLTFDGQIGGAFKITAILSCSSGNNQLLLTRVALNGTTVPQSESQISTSGNGRSENIVVAAIISLAATDYIEIFVANSTSSTNITVSELNFIVEPLI